MGWVVGTRSWRPHGIEISGPFGTVPPGGAHAAAAGRAWRAGRSGGGGAVRRAGRGAGGGSGGGGRPRGGPRGARPNASRRPGLRAAQAGAGGGGWARVEGLLAGRSWLATLAGGYGWHLLGRSRLEQQRWAEGDEALRR